MTTDNHRNDHYSELDDAEESRETGKSFSNAIPRIILPEPEKSSSESRNAGSEKIIDAIKILSGDSRKQLRAFRKFIEEYSSFSESMQRNMRELVIQQNRLISAAEKGRLTLMRNLVDVRDSLRRNIEQSESFISSMSFFRRIFFNRGSFEAVIDGQKMTLEKLNDCLQYEDVKEIPARGKPFDPQRMRAVAVEISDKAPPEHVLYVIRTGYTIGDKILRYAEVSVSAGTNQKTKDESE